MWWNTVPYVKFIWHGEWSDPELEYKGKRVNCEAIEDVIWEMYLEKHKEDEPQEVYNKFCKDNKHLVYELIESQ